MRFNVAIIGGGPGGSTLGTLLRKYEPGIEVGIFERDVFPRDHVGESQLPGVSRVLVEMGAWDKVEAAGFPIKIGATYKWGKSKELWDFQFLPKEQFKDEPRPAKFEGQRTHTAFQVDRAIYDDILLRHAGEAGCHVEQGSTVRQVEHEGDEVKCLVLDDGRRVEADFYVDASGHTGTLRRALGVETDQVTSLQNVAFWDYWENADWATEIGVGGTFVQVISLGYGWIWFIPLGLTRTSVGLIVPASFFKESGKSPQDLYAEALAADGRIAHLMRNAVSEGKFSTTKDWSFVSRRHAGKNWFLVGEAGGFADPILAAGLTITQVGARELASTIAEIRRGRFDGTWIRAQFEGRQTTRVLSHIRFADFWYTSNGQFTDLQAFTAEIAKGAGLEMTPEQAWQWLAQGAFVDEDLTFGTGGYTLEAIKALPQYLSNYQVAEALAGKNRLELNVDAADVEIRAFYGPGTVERIEAYVRGGKVLPLRWVVGPLVNIIRGEKSLVGVFEKLSQMAGGMTVEQDRKDLFMASSIRALEAMVLDGWVRASHDPSFPEVSIGSTYEGLKWSDSTTIGTFAAQTE